MKKDFTHNLPTAKDFIIVVDTIENPMKNSLLDK